MNRYLEKVAGRHHHVYKWMKEKYPEKIKSKKTKKKKMNKYLTKIAQFSEKEKVEHGRAYIDHTAQSGSLVGTGVGLGAGYLGYKFLNKKFKKHVGMHGFPGPGNKGKILAYSALASPFLGYAIGNAVGEHYGKKFGEKLVPKKYHVKEASTALVPHSKVIDVNAKVKTSTPIFHSIAQTLRKSKKTGAIVGAGAGLGALAYRAYSKKGLNDQSIHAFKGRLSPAWQESEIAKEHGKKLEGNFGETHAMSRGRTLHDSVISAGVGGVGSAVVGGAGGYAMAKRNLTKRIISAKYNISTKNLPSKSLQSLIKQRARGSAYIGALALGAIGSLAGREYGQLKSLREQAKEHHKKYAQQILDKVAELKSDTKKDLINTATIGASGFAAGALGHKIMSIPRIAKTIPRNRTAMAAGGVIGGLGLLGDYAAVKLNKHLNNRIDTK